MPVDGKQTDTAVTGWKSTIRSGATHRRTFLRSVGVAGAIGLAGCSGDSDGGGDGSSGTDSGGSTDSAGDDETVLTFWELFTGGEGPIMEKIIKRFNDERPLGDDVKIDRQRQPWDEYYDKLYTAMTGGNAPDMAIVHASYLKRYSQNVADLSDYISDDSDYVDNIWNRTKVDGERLGVPMGGHSIGIYYNEDLFEEAGVSPPFENFDQLKAACDTIKSETDALPLGLDPYGGVGMRQVYSFLRQYDGRLVNDDGSKAVFDNEAGVSMAQFVHDVPNEYGWDKPDTSGNRVTKGFQNGDIAMTINGTWYVGALNDAEDLNWAFTKASGIAPDRERKGMWADSHCISVPNGSEKVELGTEAAKWITQENPEWGTEAGHLPAYNPILNGDALQKSDLWDQTLEKFMEMARDGQFDYFPQLENFDINNGSYWDWAAAIYRGDVTPEEGVTQGVQQWNSKL